MQDNVRSTLSSGRAAALALGLAALAATGCAVEAPASAPPAAPAAAPATPGASPDPAAPDATPAPAPRAAGCLALDAELAAAVTRLGGEKAYDSVLVWSTPACPATFLTAGPSALEPSRLVRVGSVTKTFVAVTALDLVHDGALGLDDPLGRWLPELPARVHAITVRQLLQHTSGLFNYTSTKTVRDGFASDPRRVYTPRELVDLALAEPPTFAPGEGWAYSNTGYVLLGMIVEAVTKRPFAEVLRARVLGPHGLTETFFDGGEPIGGELAKGLDARGRDVTTRYDPSWAWTAGALVASPRDAHRFFGLVGAGALVDAGLVDELVRGAKATPQRGLAYGLGVFVAEPSVAGGDARLGDGVGHGGDLPGYHTWGWTFPKVGLVVFAGVTGDGGSANDLVAATLEAVVPVLQADASP